MRPALPVALAVLAMGAASTAQAGDPDENYADYSADCALLNTALGQDATRDRAEGLFHQFVAGFVSGRILDRARLEIAGSIKVPGMSAAP